MAELNLTPEILLQLMAESNQRLERMFELSNEASEKRQKEFYERQKESVERQKEFEKNQKEFYERHKEIDKKIAQFSDTLGRFAEDQVRPAALKLFKDLGIPIHEDMFNRSKYGPDNNYLYEVDILLYNTDFVIAIEVKSTLRKEDIEEHVERLKLMQQYPLKGTQGTKIIGAIAAMNAQQSIINHAIKNGFYVIIPNGSSVGIANKDDFKPRKWEIQ